MSPNVAPFTLVSGPTESENGAGAAEGSGAAFSVKGHGDLQDKERRNQHNSSSAKESLSQTCQEAS